MGLSLVCGGVGFEACVGYGFTPQPEKALGHCFHPWRPTGWAFGQAGGGKILSGLDFSSYEE